MVPAGGLAPDHSRWIDSQQKFFLPVHVLKKVFRGKFVDGLKTLHSGYKLGFHGALATLQNPKAFAAWLRPLFRTKWVVYSKRPFGGARHALRYLGQYTHRVAISNHRLVALSDGIVTFRWRDSAHKNKKRQMSLPVNEFLRRFLLHVLPPGFVRIRHFGFLAHRRRGASLPLCWSSSYGSVPSSFDCGLRQFPPPNNHDTFFLITTSARPRTPPPQVCPRCLPHGFETPECLVTKTA